MNVQFRTSFSKDLRNIKNKNLLDRIKEVVEYVEKVQSPQGISNFKKSVTTRIAGGLISPKRALLLAPHKGLLNNFS